MLMDRQFGFGPKNEGSIPSEPIYNSYMIRFLPSSFIIISFKKNFISIDKLK